VISGVGAANGDMVSLYDGASLVGSGTVSNGAWSITTTSLAAGSHSLHATESDPAGNTSSNSGALALTIDIPAVPSTPALSAASDSGTLGDGLTNHTAPVLTGSTTGANGDTVKLYDGSTLIGSGTVSSGAWSVTPTSALADGTTYSLTATETDAAGNVSTPSDGSTLIGSGTVANGAWSVTPTTALVDGTTYSLTATETDAAGNVSTPSGAFSLTIDTTPPTLLTLSDTAASDDLDAGKKIRFALTASKALKVDITGGSPTLGLSNGGTATFQRTGSDGSLLFSYTVPTSGADTADLTVTAFVGGGAVITDAAGNALDNSGFAQLAGTDTHITIDTIAPVAPSAPALTPASDSGLPGDGITGDNSPVLTGTSAGANGDAVQVYSGSTLIGTGAVIDGAWSVAPTSTLADNIYDLTATETDAAGNVSTASAAFSLTIDTIAPAAPVLTTADSNSDPARPALAGTAEASSTVTLYDGTDAVGTASTGAGGGWSFRFATALASGTHDLTATATDTAGNASAASMPVTVTVGSNRSYTVASTNSDGNTVTQSYDTAGQITRVDTHNADNLLLRSVTNTLATLEVYDDQGRLIGRITQPSNSAFSQPVFDTAGHRLSATTSSGPVGSQISFLAESNIVTTEGHDTVNAGAGNDTIYAAGPTTQVIGGSGKLFLVGGTGSMSVTGGAGSSTIFGGAGGGSAEGGRAGQNVLVAGTGNTTLVGGGAGDMLVAGSGDTTIVMQPGSVAFGGTGQSTIFGGDHGTLVGGSNHDVMAAGSGPEALWAGTGTSELYGGSGDDTMVGGVSGQATIVGGSGNNLIVGLGGRTAAHGGTGNDVFYAGSGDMTIAEGRGADNVVFGTGNATVTGGSGRDIYTVLNGHTGGADVIVGFKVGIDQVQTFGYGSNARQVQISRGDTTVGLSDGTRITFVGVTQLAGNSIV